MRHLAVAGALLWAGCGRGPSPGASGTSAAGGEPADTPAIRSGVADSVVLERSPCFGPCPVYRLVLTGTGGVRFSAPPAVGGERTGTGSVAPAAVARLLAHAERVGFFGLPGRTAEDSALCPLRATDHPTVTVAVYQGGVAKQVEDYTGCYVSTDPRRLAAPLEGLRALEAAIDSVAGVDRWASPRSRR